ncbi:MAG: hypothetical protein Q9162_007827 [Coniocarpon cinnabarinum]
MPRVYRRGEDNTQQAPQQEASQQQASQQQASQQQASQQQASQQQASQQQASQQQASQQQASQQQASQQEASQQEASQQQASQQQASQQQLQENPEPDPIADTQSTQEKKHLHFFDLPSELRRFIYFKVLCQHPSQAEFHEYSHTRHSGRQPPLHDVHPTKHSQFFSLLTASKRFSKEIRPQVVNHCSNYPDQPTMKLGYLENKRPAQGPDSRPPIDEHIADRFRWTLIPLAPPIPSREAKEFVRCLSVDIVHTFGNPIILPVDTDKVHPRSVPLQSLLTFARGMRHLEELHIKDLQKTPLRDPRSRLAMTPDEVCATAHTLQSLSGLRTLSFGIVLGKVPVPRLLCTQGWTCEGTDEWQREFRPPRWVYVYLRKDTT